MKILLYLILPFVLFAQSHLISNIPVPKTYVQLVDPYECDENCLRSLLDNGQIFSFLSHTQGRSLSDDILKESQLIYTAIFNLGITNGSGDLKIAVVVADKIIGRYATSTINSIFAYLLSKNHTFDLNVYKIDDESTKSITDVFDKLSKDGYKYVIAPFTQNGAQVLVDIRPVSYIYIPTINHELISSNLPNMYFGGISYKEQIDKLLTLSEDTLVNFYTSNSKLGSELNFDVNQKYTNVNPEGNILNYPISKSTTNLKNIFHENEKLIDSTVFLNTSLVKSSMILSQMTLYDVNSTNKLSTQINYDPLLLTMTQYNDRKDLIIANSIGENNNVIAESNELLENDIMYDWINYSTTIGIDLFYNMITAEPREYDLPIEFQQVRYDIKLMKATLSRFDEIDINVTEESDFNMTLSH
jgi:hypothetical protein